MGGGLVERISVAFKEREVDPVGEARRREIASFLRLKVATVRTLRVYTIDDDLTTAERDLLVKNLFVDPVTERLAGKTDTADWTIEVGYKPGVTDNVGRTTKDIAIPQVLNRALRGDAYTSTQYLISGEGLLREDVERIGKKLLANTVIESVRIFSRSEVGEKGVPIEIPSIRGDDTVAVKSYNLDVSDNELILISKKGVLSLSLDGMRAIRDYFKREDIIEERKRAGMDREFWARPTDVELEAIAQTWSEHCKHNIFNAELAYRNVETGEETRIDSLFRTFIRQPSLKIGERWGWVVSDFSDNGGIVRFNDRILVVDKIETHNSPSTLDPYGGAMTGIVGVNRDPMGTGMGAKLMFNVFGYCLGNPFYSGPVPEGLMHPKRIRDGVHRGVIDGGNQSGIPLVGGWESFDDRYMYRPLVFCGTIGTMPLTINGSPSHLKRANSGDLIVMAGGRVGKDGIHGATFSSAELDKGSPVQAVQIGDPITQRRLSDFIIEARDSGLYNSITDNGAGGLSSSVGEMAKDTGGFRLNLKRVPLKYSGLANWEKFVSEAQERMTLAVNPNRIDQFLKLASRRGVEASVLGTFVDSGMAKVTDGDRIVGYLHMDFLHNGVPRMKLKAVWERRANEEPEFDKPKDMNKVLGQMLARLNICSNEDRLRRYDHEVKGLSVVKPLVGKYSDTPSDATVSFLEYGTDEALAMAQGVNPYYSDIDPYHMAASVIDEAVRRIIAVGGKLPSESTVFYGLDNFCWNLSSPTGKDGEGKLGGLVRANMALREYTEAFGVPCISGKDSMTNVWRTTETAEGKETEKIISIPPTLLFSTRAKIANVEKVVTMDVKKPGDIVYVVGRTYEELGGSEYFAMMGEQLEGKRYVGNGVPQVRKEDAIKTYRGFSEATERELVHSCHTPTTGGLGVALAKSAMAGGYGMDVDLTDVPYSGSARDDFLLFSQSNSRFVVTVPAEKAEEFERLMNGTQCARVGVVTEESRLKVTGLSGNLAIDADLDALRESWSGVLKE